MYKHGLQHVTFTLSLYTAFGWSVFLTCILLQKLAGLLQWLKGTAINDLGGGRENREKKFKGHPSGKK